MPLSARVLLIALLALAVAPAAAHAAARFTASFSAERSATWDEPRIVSMTNCKGDHWGEQSGEDSWKVTSRASFPVKVVRYGKMVAWEFGDGPKQTDPRRVGIEAAGVRTRRWNWAAGTTGGWCGGGDQKPKPENDCGTRLPTVLLLFVAGPTGVTWSMQPALWTVNEKLDFYKCPLIVPEGFAVGSFPKLSGAISTKDLFSAKTRTVTISASKKYGPEKDQLTSTAERTTSAEASWTLKLSRRK